MIKKTERKYNFDMLRIVACVMVVLIHVAAVLWYESPYNSFDFVVYNFFDSLARSAVPLFVMLSGAFMLQKKEIDLKTLWQKKILKLVVFYVFWSVVFYFFNAKVNNLPITIPGFIEGVLSGPAHLWFIPMIIGLYVLSPLLCKIANHMNDKLVRYFIVIFIACCVLETIKSCLFLPKSDLIGLAISKTPVSVICQYVGYFLLGNFLYNYDFSKNKRKILYIAGIVSVFACFGLTFVMSKYMGNNSEVFYSNFVIFTLLEAMAIFVLFKEWKIKPSEKAKKLIDKMSGDTLGIYAIHPMIITLIYLYTPLWQTVNALLVVPIALVVVTILSALFAAIVKRIKFIGRWIV